MAFSELTFLFLFFPIALLLHTLMPRPGKNVILLITSLVFFAWGTPEYLILMLCSIGFNYFTGMEMADLLDEGNDRRAKFVLISAVVVNLLLLGFFKYYGFLVDNINAILGTSITARQLPMPIGVSFFTFTLLSYLYDVYRDKAPVAENIFDFALYVTFFPKLVSGPIVQYKDMEEQIWERSVNAAKIGSGCRLFIIGLAKKILISGPIGTTFYAVTALPADQISVVTGWLGAITYALMLYFDFSGYSDMAIGLAQMFGFKFEKNFDYPYISSSITEFWRRWHISLGAWFRDYVYIPLGGSRAGTGATIRNLCIVWLLTGIWHGASWNFIFWGIYYGGLLLLEKFVFKNILEHIPVVIKRIFTLFLVLIGWVFFFSTSLTGALTWLGRMFGIGAAGFIDSNALYYLAGSWLMILVGIIGSIPLPTKLGSRIYRKNGIAIPLSVIFFAVLMLLCIAGMMSSTYSSFLYFQF